MPDSTVPATPPQASHTFAAITPVVKDELMLIGRINNVWHGPSWTTWCSDLFDNIQLKNCTTEIGKITQARSQIHSSKGEFRKLLSTHTDLLNISVFQDFLDALKAFVLPEHSVHHFEAFSRLSNFKWTSDHNISSCSLTLRKLVKDYLDLVTSLDASLTFNDTFVNILTTTFLYNLIPDNLQAHRRLFIQNYDPKLKLPQQLEKYLKLADGMLYQLPQNASQPPTTDPHPLLDVNLISKSRKAQNSTLPTPQFSTPKIRSYNAPRSAHPKSQQQTSQICWHCEKAGHFSNMCVYNPYCHKCHNYHIRGTTPDCRGSRIDPLNIDFPVKFAPITPHIESLIQRGLWKGTGILRPQYRGVKPPMQNHPKPRVPQQPRPNFSQQFTNTRKPQQNQRVYTNTRLTEALSHGENCFPHDATPPYHQPQAPHQSYENSYLYENSPDDDARIRPEAHFFN